MIKINDCNKTLRRIRMTRSGPVTEAGIASSAIWFWLEGYRRHRRGRGGGGRRLMLHGAASRKHQRYSNHRQNGSIYVAHLSCPNSLRIELQVTERTATALTNDG